MNIIDFARQVIDMQETLDWQTDEISRLLEIEKKYKALLGESLEHSQTMVGNMFKLFTTPGVLDACVDANKEKQ